MTDLTPTDEQRAILEARGRIVKINARAGTGKTTTLRILAEQFSYRRILYLVFNRRARESAQSVRLTCDRPSSTTAKFLPLCLSSC